MKYFLEYNAKNIAKVKKLKKLYIVGYWANYGVRDYPFSGKYNKDDIPMVYDYDDHNGTYEEYALRSLDQITTGRIICWTFNELNAYDIMVALRNNVDSGDRSEDS